MTWNIVGFGDSGISGEKMWSFNFIESSVKSAEIVIFFYSDNFRYLT